jgi:hypothetical protein
VKRRLTDSLLDSEDDEEEGRESGSDETPTAVRPAQPSPAQRPAAGRAVSGAAKSRASLPEKKVTASTPASKAKDQHLVSSNKKVAETQDTPVRTPGSIVGYVAGDSSLVQDLRYD